MLYVDVDAISKLAHWEILPALPELTGHAWSQMATVSSLKYRAQRAMTAPDGKLFLTTNAAEIAVRALEQMAVLDEPDPDLLAEFAGSTTIDQGEAVLMAVTLQHGGSVLTTGDKRAVRGLAAMPISTRFSGRVRILEQVVAMCLHAKGRAWLLQHACPHRSIDKAVAACLGSTCTASEADIVAGLSSYIGEIDRLCVPTLLCPTVAPA